MSGLGWILAFLGFIGLIVGLLQMLKGKKMNSVPFRAPSQIAQMGPQAADAKGLVSTEGAVGQQGLLTAPMSGRPCLAFEISVERKYEKQERTENGMKTVRGSSNIFSDYRGGMFSIQDGQGQVFVDASERPDASFEKSHSSGVNVGILGIIPGTLQFGNFQMNTPLLTGEGSTTGFEGVEKIIPPSPNLYALGALAASPNGPVMHTPKGIGTGKLILSTKGRAQLVSSTKTKMIVGYALGGVMFVGGTLMGIFAPAPPPRDPNAKQDHCESTLNTEEVACDGRMYEREGYDMKWTVKTAGDFTIVAKQPPVKFPIMATLTVKDATGKEIAHDDGGVAGAEAKVTQHLEPGTYTINVRDFLKDKVSGGYGFRLEITKKEAPAPAVASANITSADMNGSKPAAKAGSPAMKAGANVAGAKAGTTATAAASGAAAADAKDPKAAASGASSAKAAPAASGKAPAGKPAAPGKPAGGAAPAAPKSKP
ncbi:MAG: hypothetical protein JST00_47410 [Deltaproteobacteria bacterium]|nr:hypothetical protein [Deltaproteobacteria bacterium]